MSFWPRVACHLFNLLELSRISFRYPLLPEVTFGAQVPVGTPRSNWNRKIRCNDSFRMLWLSFNCTSGPEPTLKCEVRLSESGHS